MNMAGDSFGSFATGRCPHEIDSMSAMLRLRQPVARMQPVAKGHELPHAVQQRGDLFPWNRRRDRLR
jgi:hypothetical protein